jgi:hypothetical protein
MRSAALVLAVTTLALPSVAPARSTADDLDGILARHFEARGGLARIRAVQTMTIRRTVPTLGSTVEVVIFKKRPNWYRSEQSVAGRPAVMRGLDPDGLWEARDGKVTRLPQVLATELAELEGDFDGMLVDHREKGHHIALAGRGVEAGVEVHRLEVTLKSGAVRHVLLDAQTYLERKQIGQLTLAPDLRKVGATLLFSDYREVGGLKFPFAIDDEREAMGQTFPIYVDRIELDTPLDDALFVPPASPGP